jgi:hypothetical protein
MKTSSILFAGFALSFGLGGQSAEAEEGVYFALGITRTAGESAEPIFFREFTGNDVGLALTVGYAFAPAGNLTFGVEGNLDVLSGNRFDDAAGGLPACSGAGPSWCEVDAILRLRGTLSTDLANGSRVSGSIGPVLVKGITENGGADYLATTGTGISVGVSWALPDTSMPLRVDFNYDSIRRDNAEEYSRTLDMVGFRVSYTF